MGVQCLAVGTAFQMFPISCKSGFSSTSLPGAISKPQSPACPGNECTSKSEAWNVFDSACLCKPRTSTSTTFQPQEVQNCDDEHLKKTQAALPRALIFGRWARWASHQLANPPYQQSAGVSFINSAILTQLEWRAVCSSGQAPVHLDRSSMFLYRCTGARIVCIRIEGLCPVNYIVDLKLTGIALWRRQVAQLQGKQELQ